MVVPRRLLQQSPPASPASLSGAVRLLGGADPDVLRALIESVAQTTLEREHEEIRRRTRVIRIFPNEASYLRLATALAADRNDAWAKRRYIIPATPTAVAQSVKRARRRAA